MKIIIYEDNVDYFYPLINFYPQFDLRIGLRSLCQNNEHWFGKTNISFLTRKHLGFKAIEPQGPTLYLSARAILNKKINPARKDTKFTIDSTVIGFFKKLPPFPKSLSEIKKTAKKIDQTQEISGFVLDKMWDLIRLNSHVLKQQFRVYKRKRKKSGTYKVIGNSTDLYIGKGAVIHDQVAIDVSSGPVYIADDAVIRSFSTIIGPSYIGAGTIIDRAKIIESSIGPACRIGGEVEACIFQGYANKYHEGFLGHSFIGEWVNLGALTTNSDLKNNYSTVRIKIGTKEFDTGMTKIGCFIGDHTKLGIGTLVPTGAVIGCFVNFFGGGMMARQVPDFTWLNSRKRTRYRLERALKTAEIVMQRRGIIMSEHYKDMIRARY